jgi:hypothetical protein
VRGRLRDHNEAVMDPDTKLEFAHGLSPASARRLAPPNDSPNVRFEISVGVFFGTIGPKL